MKPKQIEAIIKKIEESLIVYGATPRTVRAASLALEEILLTLSCDSVEDIINCSVERTEESLSINLDVKKEVSVDALSDTNTSIILNSICKNNHYKLSISSTIKSHHINLLLETYNPLIEDLVFFQIFG